MTFERLDAFREYWRLNPPMHQLVATYMQYKAPEPEKTPEENVAALMKALGG